MSESLMPRTVTLLPAMGLFIACGAAEAPPAPTITRSASGYEIVHNVVPTAWQDTSGWKLVPEFVIAPTGDTLSELVDPYTLALDSRGNIYINERRDAHIKVFDARGTFLRRIGAAGEGPGEFRGLVMAMRGDTIIAHDPRLGRTTLLDPDGTLLFSWPTSCCNYAPVVAEADGGVLIPGEIGRSEDAAAQNALGAFGWIRYAADGTMRDSLYSPPGLDVPVWHYYEGPNRQHSIAGIPWMPQRIRVRTPHGLMLHGNSAEYRLVLSQNDRDTVRVIEREAEPVAIADSLRSAVVRDRIAQVPELATVAKLEDVPTHYPRMGTPVVASDGAIWVPVAGATMNARFDVFNDQGVLLGSVVNPLPSGRAWLMVGDRARAVDLEGDVPAVHVFRVVR
jgi:hypothetical protein